MCPVCYFWALFFFYSLSRLYLSLLGFSSLSISLSRSSIFFLCFYSRLSLLLLCSGVCVLRESWWKVKKRLFSKSRIGFGLLWLEISAPRGIFFSLSLLSKQQQQRPLAPVGSSKKTGDPEMTTQKRRPMRDNYQGDGRERDEIYPDSQHRTPLNLLFFYFLHFYIFLESLVVHSVCVCICLSRWVLLSLYLLICPFFSFSSRRFSLLYLSVRLVWMVQPFCGRVGRTHTLPDPRGEQNPSGVLIFSFSA